VHHRSTPKHPQNYFVQPTKRAGHTVRIWVIVLTDDATKSTQMLDEMKILANEPTTEKRTVQLRRLKNSAYRTREFLLGEEVDSLIKAAKSRGRYGLRDATMILVAYNHGLRVKELCNLQWTMIDFKAGLLNVVRVKNGQNSTHPLSGVELRALRALQREEGPVASCLCLSGVHQSVTMGSGRHWSA
jgi:integrase